MGVQVRMQLKSLLKINKDNVIILISSLSVVVISYNTTALVTALPVMQKDFGISPSNLQWLLNLYIMASMAFMLPVGRLYDILDKKKLFILTLLIYSISSLVMIISPDSTILFIGRACQGVGAALIASGSLAIIKVSIKKEKLHSAIALWSAISGLGFCVGPFLGGVFTEFLGWKFIFWFAIIICCTCIFLTLRFLDYMPAYRNSSINNSIDNRRCTCFVFLKEIDLFALFIFIPFLIFFVLFLVGIANSGFQCMSTLYYLLITVILFFIFIRFEIKGITNLLSLFILKNKVFSLSLFGITAVMAIVGMGIPYIFNLYAQNSFTLNFTVFEAGMALLPLTVGCFLGSIFSVYFINRLGFYFSILFSFGLMITGVIILLIQIDFGIVNFIYSFSLMGFASGSSVSILSTLGMKDIESSIAGRASGLLNIVFYISDLIGTTIFSIVFFVAGRHYLYGNGKYLSFLIDKSDSVLNNLVLGNNSTVNAVITNKSIDSVGFAKLISATGLGSFYDTILFSFVIILITFLIFAFILPRKN